MRDFINLNTLDKVKTRREQLKTEFGSLRKDWLEKKGVNLQKACYSELKQYIHDFYKENKSEINESLETQEDTLEKELETIPSHKMDYERVAKMRKSLGLPKWISLSEAVAFIKTVLDYNDESIKDRYADYCSKGISLDDMREVLAYENDVKPARLDTDIYHQSPQRSRAAVEIVSNAIDAMQPAVKSIGRFGVGFYQILSHLNENDDILSLETGNPESGFYSIGFRLRNKEIQFSFNELEDKEDRGTTVSLITNNFPKEEAEALVKKHFAYNHAAEVACNGENVNKVSSETKVTVEINHNGFTVVDKGVGMSPQVILEKLLVPKISGKRSINELIKEQAMDPEYFIDRFENGDLGPAKAVINVGGVMIEEVPVKGVNVLKNLVLEMPSFTLLGEERNAIAVDGITIESCKKLIDKVVSEGDIATLNSLAPVIKKLQARSQSCEQKDNMVSYIQERVQEKFSGFNGFFFPNTAEFERLDLPNIVLMDPMLKQSAWKTVPGLQAPLLTGGGSAVYVAPIKYKDALDPIIITDKNRVVLDKEVYDSLKHDPTLINLYLEAFSKAGESDIRSLENFDEEKAQSGQKIESEQGSESKKFKDLNDFLEKNWQRLGATDLYSIQKMIEFPLSADYESRIKDIENFIINKFPFPSAKKFVVDLIINNYPLSKDLIKNVASLSQNPELVELLDELGISPYAKESNKTKEAAEFEKFPGFGDRYNDKKAKKISDLGYGWYKIHYYGEETLVSGDGRIYKGKFQISEDQKIIALYDESVKKLKFINAETNEISKTAIPLDNLDNNFGRLFDFIDIFGEKCVCLYRERENFYKDPRDRSDNRSYHRGFLYRISDGEEVRLDLQRDDRIVVGVYDDRRRQNCILCERPNPRYRRDYRRSFFDLDQDNSPKTAIPSLLNPITGKISENMDEWDDITADVLYQQKKPEYIYEVTPNIKIRLDWKKQSMELFVSNELKQEFAANVREKPEDSIFPRHWASTRNITIDSFGDRGNEGILIHNRRSEWSEEANTNLIWFEDRIINSQGEIVYEGKQNQHIRKVKGFDHEDYFVVYESPQNQSAGGGNLFLMASFSNLEEYASPVFAVDSKCRKLSGDELKIIPPCKTRFRIGQHGTGGLFSLYQPEQNVSVDLHSGITLESGLGPERFFNCVYHRDKDLWEFSRIGESGKRELRFVDKMGVIQESGEISKVDYYHEDDFDQTHFLSKGKTSFIQKTIEGFEEQDVEKIKLFLNRTFAYDELDDDAYGIIAPILIRLRHTSPKVMDSSLIKSLEKRVGNYDIDNQVAFYEFLGRSIPDKTENIEKDLEIFLEKLIKIFDEKIAVLPATDKEEVLKLMSELRNYKDEYLTTGWNIVQNQSKVSAELIPEKIRPIIEYLRTDERDSMSFDKKEKISMHDANPGFTLSQLIQAKRLNETEVSNFSGNTEDLIRMVEEKTSGKKQDHIKREIIHPIYYQSVNNPYLFIRELVQNAHDALIESPVKENKAVKIDLLSRSEDSLTVRIEDPVGMSKKTLLNHFLVPGETTKKDKKEQIGYFGQGLFTLFRGAMEVLVKTGIGDGLTTKMRIAPCYADDGTLSDLDVAIEEEKEEYKGTTIERTIQTKYPQVEAAYVKNAICSFTSLVDANIVDIKLNGGQINQPQSVLSKVEIPGLGDLKIYEAPNNAVTQRGLFVKTIDHDYDSGMFDVENFLKKRGYVLQIPDHLDLTRSRNEIAQKEKILPIIQDMLPVLKVGAYLELFKKDIERGSVIQLDNLPYDFFYNPGSGSGAAYEDAQLIRRGKTIKNLELYRDRGALINLLIHLPVAEIDDQIYSMYELRQAALSRRAPLDRQENFKKLPNLLRRHLEQGQGSYESMQETRQRAVEKGEIVNDFSLSNPGILPGFVKDMLERHKEAYKAFNESSESWFKYLDKIFLEDGSKTENKLFYEPGDISAHASSLLGYIGWNLNTWKDWKVNKFANTDGGDRHFIDYLYTLSHEYAHIVEKTLGMTHNKDFYLKQAQILSQMAKRGRLTM